MRFVFLVVSAVATGALSVLGVRTLAPQPGQTFQAPSWLSRDGSGLNLGDLNPIRQTYDNVVQQITSGQPAAMLPTSTTITIDPIDRGVYYRPPVIVETRPAWRSWGGDVNRHVHHEIARAPEYHPPAHHPAVSHGGGHPAVSHGGGGHGRR
jgi:hypothetical protein